MMGRGGERERLVVSGQFEEKVNWASESEFELVDIRTGQHSNVKSASQPDTATEHLKSPT